ncbi:MAG: HAD-IIB family hydrolase [Patescibacteria group bacterium]
MKTSFNKKSLREKDLIIFDLDGTLTESKSDMDVKTAKLILRLLQKKLVAVIGGGNYNQFKKQFIGKLNSPRGYLKNLFLFPTTATSFYRYKNGWQRVYQEVFLKTEKKKIMLALPRAIQKSGYIRPSKVYGKLIEDRGSQISFSALGQDIVAILGKRGVALKEKWRKENTPLKLRIVKILQRMLPEFEVRAAGYTTIDITRKGIDKAYGVRQIRKKLGVSIKKMVFVGDALFPGGNDYAARKTGIDCIQISGPKETREIIRAIISSSKN